MKLISRPFYQEKTERNLGRIRLLFLPDKEGLGKVSYKTSSSKKIPDRGNIN